MFPDSRQDLEVIRAHFVVFCQLVGPDVRAQWLEGNIRDVGHFGCSRFEVKFRQSVAQIEFFSELREAHRYNALVDFDRGEPFDEMGWKPTRGQVWS